MFQEKTEIEKRLLAELERERQRYVSEKTNFASDYDELKKALEDKFLRDKSNLEANFAREKLELKKSVEELRQIFTIGESGLKGKLKDDFLRLVSEHKSLLEDQHGKQEDEIKMLKDKTQKCTDEMEELKSTIEHLKEQHESEVKEIETRLVLSMEGDVLFISLYVPLEIIQIKISSFNSNTIGCFKIIYLLLR